MDTGIYENIRRDATPVAFHKTIGLFGATTLGVGAMLGAGLYVLIGYAAGHAGPALWVSYIICGLLTFLTVLVYGDFARQKTISGGGYFYAYDQLGSFWGFMVGWHLAIGSVFACALYAHGFAAYSISFVGFDSPPSWIVRAIGGLSVVLLLLSSLRGSKGGNIVGMIFTWGNVAILLAIAAIGFSNYQGTFYSVPMPNGVLGIGSAISLIYISFFGFQLIANNSEEIRSASKNVPRAMILSLTIAFAVYLLVVVAAIGAVGYSRLAASDAPLMLLAAYAPGQLGAFLIGLGGILASAAALNSTLVSQGRQIFAMGRDGMLPNLLGAVTKKRRLPSAALIAGGVASMIAAVMVDASFLAKAANFALLFAMLPVCISLHKFYAEGDAPVPKWKRILPFGAFIANGALLTTLDLQSLLFGGVLVGAGCAVFLAYSRSAEERGRLGFSVSLASENRRLSLLSGSNRILVPLGNPDTIEPLFSISQSLLPKSSGEIVALRVATSVDGTDPRVLFQNKQLTGPAVEAVQKMMKMGKKAGTQIRPVVRSARSLSEGIRHAAIEEKCSLVVMGWTGNENKGPSDLLKDVVTKSNLDFVFLHMRQKKSFQKIGVALGGMNNLVLMAQIAGTLGEYHQGEVTYFSVLPKHYTQEELEHTKSLQTEAILHHKGLVSYRTELYTADNPLQAIVEASKKLDLLLVGSAPARTMEQDTLVGSFTTSIIEQSHCPVIVVRRTIGFGRLIPHFVSDMFTEV